MAIWLFHNVGLIKKRLDIIAYDFGNGLFSIVDSLQKDLCISTAGKRFGIIELNTLTLEKRQFLPHY